MCRPFPCIGILLIRKEVSLSARFLDDQFFFGLDASVATDVVEWDSAGLKHVAEEQTAVARGGIFLAAHDGDAMLRCARFETLNALDEQRRFREPLVDYMAVRVMERGFGRLAAEFPA